MTDIKEVREYCKTIAQEHTLFLITMFAVGLRALIEQAQQHGPTVGAAIATVANTAATHVQEAFNAQGFKTPADFAQEIQANPPQEIEAAELQFQVEQIASNDPIIRKVLEDLELIENQADNNTNDPQDETGDELQEAIDNGTITYIPVTDEMIDQIKNSNQDNTLDEIEEHEEDFVDAIGDDEILPAITLPAASPTFEITERFHSYKELQKMAKQRGIKANLPKAELKYALGI